LRAITNLDALAPLSRLVTFEASANAIDPDHCPVAPVAMSKALSDFCTSIRSTGSRASDGG